ncbi:MAG: thioredoxin family protein [Candidatus Riflebacteria bacterium]|nr:thioredoxin family protein [Candidatus Riflebacteria bacterium]
MQIVLKEFAMKLSNISYIFLAASLFLSSGCGAASETTTPAQPAAQINASASQPETPATANASDTSSLKLPRIIDFGSKQCQACKAMEPILESLAKNHADKFKTEFVDVWVPENQTFARSYGIQSIPTQVFLNAEGKEVYRNTGFISEEDVVAKFAELGVISAGASESDKAPSAGETVETPAPAVEPTASKTVAGE